MEKVDKAFNDLAEIFSDYDIHNQPLMKLQVMRVLQGLAAPTEPKE